MNDFMKDELEDLLIIVGEWGSHDIYRKLKSMIDTYEAKEISVWHCEKCGHVQ